MKKLQLFDKAFKVNNAINNNDYQQLAYALGLTDKMIEEMSILDIVDSINVRLGDLAKEIEQNGGFK